MVRVGSLTDLSLLKKSIIDPKSGMTPAQQLDAIYARCHELYPYYEETYKTVRSLLAEQGIRGLHKEDLTAEQRDYLRGYMEDNVLPFLSPQIINARHPFPHLENGGLYIVARRAASSNCPATGCSSSWWSAPSRCSLPRSSRCTPSSTPTSSA